VSALHYRQSALVEGVQALFREAPKVREADALSTIRVSDDATGGGVTLTGGALTLARAVITYATTMATDASVANAFSITATDGVAFTVSAPTNPVTGRQITYTIRNGTGGALGTATWNAVFKMAAWTQPATATSRSITFIYDGTNWVELSRTPADVAN
jgi:hypothetical protein